jgi:hypothetical protein
MTFDEWHQAWRRLLELIRTFIPIELQVWEAHYAFILNNESRAEKWPLYLAYDVEIRKRSTQIAIDPSEFSIGIWNDLETRYMANKVLSIVQSDLKHVPDRASSHNTNPRGSRLPNQNAAFRGQQSATEDAKSGRCIFCGYRGKDHPSKYCTAACFASGAPCFLQKHESSVVLQGPVRSRSLTPLGQNRGPNRFLIIINTWDRGPDWNEPV